MPFVILPILSTSNNYVLACLNKTYQQCYDPIMQTEQIVSLLVAERDRLSRAIEALQGPTKRRGRPPKNPTFDYNHPSVPDWVKPPSAKAPAHRKRTMSAEVRARMAAGQKRRWAAIRAGKATSPFAAKKGKKANA